MYEHLCVSLHSLIKLVVRNLCIVKTNLVADNKARLRLACYDEVSQVSIVLLDVALTSCQ